TYGVDKVSMDERVAWAEENTDQILRTAREADSDRFWEDADKPFQFLAAAGEFAGLHRSGHDHECHLPIRVDGTCNGLQHLAALMRDPFTGALVNLTPGDKPADCYRRVATAVTALNEQVLAGELTIVGPNKRLPESDVPALNRRLATLWRDYGID